MWLSADGELCLDCGVIRITSMHAITPWHHTVASVVDCENGAAQNLAAVDWSLE